MKKIKTIIFIMFAGFFCACIATAADIDRKHYESNKHAISNNATCEDCHATNNPTEAPEALATCISCHGDYTELAQTTANVIPNPHRTHFTDMPCGECHKIHNPSSMQACTTCHSFEMKVP